MNSVQHSYDSFLTVMKKNCLGPLAGIVRLRELCVFVFDDDDDNQGKILLDEAIIMSTKKKKV